MRITAADVLFWLGFPGLALIGIAVIGVEIYVAVKHGQEEDE